MSYKFREKNKKFLAGLVMFVVILTSFSPIFAVTARAQYVDFMNSAKEYVLDPIAWMLAKTIMQRISASTVNWINSGFQGSPAFVTNPEAYFSNIGDQVAGQFIFSNPNLNFLCGTMGAKIKVALARGYLNQNNANYQCTLTGVGQNFDDFMGDFQNGGWDNFFELTQRQQNNPIGAYLQAENQMNQKIASKVNTKLTQLNQGKGFMSFQKCEGATQPPDPFTTPGSEADCTSSGGTMKTVTPGVVIADQLNKTLGVGNDSLVTADEISEIVASLFSQLTSRVFGSIGGLLGASSNSPSEPSVTSQMLQSTAQGTTDYFGNPPPTYTTPKNNYTTVIIDGQVYTSSTDNTGVTDSIYCLPEQENSATKFRCIYPRDYDCIAGPGAIDLIKENRRLSKLSIFAYSTAANELLNRDCPPLGVDTTSTNTTGTTPPPPPSSSGLIVRKMDTAEIISSIALNVGEGIYISIFNGLPSYNIQTPPDAIIASTFKTSPDTFEIVGRRVGNTSITFRDFSAPAQTITLPILVSSAITASINVTDLMNVYNTYAVYSQSPENTLTPPQQNMTSVVDNGNGTATYTLADSSVTTVPLYVFKFETVCRFASMIAPFANDFSFLSSCR